MTTHQLHDLKIETLPDGTIRLEQRNGDSQTPALIDIHPDQLVLVAKLLDMDLAPNSDASAIAADNWRLRRRLLKLDALIGSFVGAECYRGEILERCGMGLEIIAELDALRVVSVEFVADLARSSNEKNGSGALAMPEPMPTPSSPRENASAVQGESQMTIPEAV